MVCRKFNTEKFTEDIEVNSMTKTADNTYTVASMIWHNSYKKSLLTCQSKKIPLWERSSTGNISVKTIFGAGAVDESFGIIQFRKCDGGVASTSDDGTGHGYTYSAERKWKQSVVC